MVQDNPLLVLTSENGFSLSTSVVSNLSFPKSSSFGQASIMNRSSAIITYGAGENIIFGVTFYFVALDEQNFSAKDVNNVVQGLMALSFPMQPGVYGSPKCYITLGSGNIFKNWPCVCKSVDPHVGEDHLWDTDQNSFTAMVNCQFIGFETENVSSSKFGGGGLSSWKQLSFGDS
jgi:hypothetical protein